MKVKCIHAENDKNITLGKVYEVLSEEFLKIRSVRGYKIINDIGEEVVYGKNKFVTVKESGEMKELTFREVIANIKEGEVWESPFKKIACNKIGDIVIEEDNSEDVLYFDKNTIYKLARQEYTFQEALEALENGKVIESCVSGYCIYKNFNEEYVVYISNEGDDYFSGDEPIFSAEEVKGKWYING